MRRITDRQRELLEFLVEYEELHGRPAAIVDIQSALGYRHHSAVSKALLALEKKRYIARQDGVRRGVVVLVAA